MSLHIKQTAENAQPPAMQGATVSALQPYLSNNNNKEQSLTTATVNNPFTQTLDTIAATEAEPIMGTTTLSTLPQTSLNKFILTNPANSLSSSEGVITDRGGGNFHRVKVQQQKEKENVQLQPEVYNNNTIIIRTHSPPQQQQKWQNLYNSDTKTATPPSTLSLKVKGIQQQQSLQSSPSYTYTSNNDVPYGYYRNTFQQHPQAQHTQQNANDINDVKYKLFTIYGNEPNDNEKLSAFAASGYCLPHSATTGSLSSIITTSIASSEPEPGSVGGDSSGVVLGGSRSGCGGAGSGSSGGGGENGHDTGSIAGTPGSIDEKLALNRPGIKQEKWHVILLQVSIPFFLAGIGTIGAGIILGRVEKWRVFKAISELFILVPALLGLKGNLDMCLASRLSTQVNLGNMNSQKEVIRMIVGNIALVQVQATVASFLVAMFAVAVGAALDGSFEFEHMMLLTASAMFTATSSCFVLDFVLVAVILLSQKFRLNPDNLATPLAASIGDVVSISLLSFIASLLFDIIDTHLWITFVVVCCYLVLLPLWVIVVLKNCYTRSILKSGWVPVLSALCISGLGGLVLDAAVEVFNGFVVFQPIINGIGGNLVSVQASKISTMLHQSSIIGIIPPYTKVFEWPWKALFKGVPYARTSRILILMSIPGNLLFIFVADYIHMSTTTITVAFALAYLVSSLIQVMLLLYIAHIIVHAMWKRKIDPDNSSIPYLTALGDLLGSSLLALAFLFLVSIGQEYGADLNQLNAPN